MDIILVLLSLVLGGFFLYVSGDILVENSKRLGQRLKVDPILIGLTVVAFGTSAPELFVSVQSALSGQPDLALGNVVGSNITNVLLILGLSAVICPISISKRTIIKDIPVMIAASVLFLLLSLDLLISRFDAMLMLACMFIYLKYEINLAKKETEKFSTEHEAGSDNIKNNEIIYIIASLLGLMLGSKLLIYGATKIAMYLGISELVIGLTIVAVGTSLPEVVTSCIAAKKGESSIAIGNVVGSNIFNILTVMGAASFLKPVPVALAALSFDIPIMIFSALICLPIVMTEKVITKAEGKLLLGLYITYLVYLTLIAKEHASVPVLSEIMLVFILPLAALYYYQFRENKKSKQVDSCST